MALVLLHMRRTLSNLTPKSLMVCTIQRICEQQLATATYSASVVDCATEDCFREDQQMREDPRKWQVPKVLFRSIPQSAKSASEKLTRSSEEEAEYQIPNSGVCLRYLKARAQPHDELNVWPCRCEVQEGADHALVLSLVHSLFIFIFISTKRGHGAYRSRH
jgi:hypothetical protein